MKRVSAAGGRIIEMTPDRWRLLAVGEAGEERGLLEAVSDGSLRYSAEFATTRRMPRHGALPVRYIQQVVLGWSQEDEAWHLGLVLARGLADARGSRWCALARWPDPDTTVFDELSFEAGEALANVLERPFNKVPPSRRKVPAPAPTPIPALPGEIGGWHLKKTGDSRLELKRSRRWALGRLSRAAWYAFWLVIYVILSTTTLSANLALPNAGTMLPNPELLPYLGLLAAAVLIFLIFQIIYQVLTRPDRIIIDGEAQMVTAHRGRRTRWQVPQENLQSIYVTQVVNKRGKKRTVYHGEINLHLEDGAFHMLLLQPDQQEEERLRLTGLDKPQEAILPLDSAGAVTDLQSAGLHIAKTLNELPVWYDQRLR